MAADPYAVTELVRFTFNDSDLYRQRWRPIVENLARKMRKGQYDKTKAVKLVQYLANDAAKKYAKEFATPSQWNTIFSAATRKEAAKELLEDYIEDNALEEASKTNPSRKTQRNFANVMVPHGKKNPARSKRRKTMRRSGMNPFAKGKRLKGASIPKGKKKGDLFTKSGRTYLTVSYVDPRSGKRVRYAAPVKGIKRTTKARKAGTAKTITVPKGKKKGQKFTRSGKSYQVVSYTTPKGKRVRYAKRV